MKVRKKERSEEEKKWGLISIVCSSIHPFRECSHCSPTFPGVPVFRVEIHQVFSLFASFPAWWKGGGGDVEGIRG